MWIVRIERPGPLDKWDFQSDFFPRKTRYKKEAEDYAGEARRKGAQGVTVDKVGKSDDPSDLKIIADEMLRPARERKEERFEGIDLGIRMDKFIKPVKDLTYEDMKEKVAQTCDNVQTIRENGPHALWAYNKGFLDALNIVRRAFDVPVKEYVGDVGDVAKDSTKQPK